MLKCHFGRRLILPVVGVPGVPNLWSLQTRMGVSSHGNVGCNVGKYQDVSDFNLWKLKLFCLVPIQNIHFVSRGAPNIARINRILLVKIEGRNLEDGGGRRVKHMLEMSEYSVVDDVRKAFGLIHGMQIFAFANDSYCQVKSVVQKIFGAICGNFDLGIKARIALKIRNKIENTSRAYFC